MSELFLNRRGLLSGGSAAALLALAGCSTTLTDISGGSRTIGFDLWAGAPGAKFGDPVDVRIRSRRIHGPYEWRHPVTGENILVYVRENDERRGKKVQYFTQRQDGSALARVFDSRPGRPDRHFTGDAFFPIGRWTEDERQKYPMTEHVAGVRRDFTVQLKVRDADLAWRGNKEAVRYDWLARDVAGRKVFHERYVYAPGVGFLDFEDRMS